MLGAWLSKAALSSTPVSCNALTAVRRLRNMSDHYLSLKETAKVRYRLKLQLLGIPLESDPYTSGNANFQDDMTAWPPVEYSHIFGYFIRRPGVYTQEQLLSWKQLDSYNYFTNRYVRTVMVWDLKNSSSCKVLKAFVNPSNYSNDHDNMSHGTWKLAENSYGCEVGTYMYLFAKCLIPATQLGGH